MNTLHGSCLCGTVTFAIKDDFDNFHFCHCIQCQKSTGTANAANLFTHPDNITWLSGTDSVVRYDVPGRRISNVFCHLCGGRVPWLSLSGDTLAVPAGCLDDTPSLAVGGNIFWPERASWYDQGLETQRHDGFPES